MLGVVGGSCVVRDVRVLDLTDWAIHGMDLLLTKYHLQIGCLTSPPHLHPPHYPSLSFVLLQLLLIGDKLDVAFSFRGSRKHN